MARNKQQLINYHTGSASAMPLTTDVHLGEIVVRHNAEVPQLLIKVNDNGTEKFVPFIASGAISTAINAAQTTLEGSVGALENSVSALSASVVNNYWTSATTDTKIGDAKTELIGANTDATTADTIWAAKNYADAQDKALSGNLYDHISVVSGNIENSISTVQQDVAALKAFSGKVETDYATKTEVQTAKDAAVTSAYTNAKADVIGTSADNAEADTVYGAKAYAKGLNDTLSGNVVTYVDGKIDAASSDVSDLSGSVISMSAAVETFSANAETYINNKLSTVYDYKGSVATVGDLPATGEKTGDVYNVVAANGQPGDVDYTPAGTNYAWNGNVWDALGGTVDLSAYATNDALNYVSGQVETLQSADAAVKTALSAVSSTLFTVSASVVNDYALSANTTTEIGKAKTEAEIASSAYTDSQIQMLSGITSAYVASELTGVKSDISDLKSFTANTAATHDEVATQSAATFDSAYTAAVASAKNYTDSRETALIGGASEDANTLKKLEDQIDAVSGDADSRLTVVEGDVSDLKTSATTWNAMAAGSVTGGTLATVETASSTQSGAKMATDAQTIKLDLSELIIDCGEF